MNEVKDIKQVIKTQRIRKAVIPAAGLGTRFLPATKAQPKEMLPLVDKPCIQYIVEEVLQSGIEQILVITGRNKRAIEDHFDRNTSLEMVLRQQGNYELLEKVRAIDQIEMFYIRQKEALGLGHAILCAKNFVGDEPFAVLLGDDIIDAEVPCLKQLLNAYEENPGTILGVQEVPHNKVSKYGIIKPVSIRENFWLVEDIVEKPSMAAAPSRLAVLGRYILQPEIFAALEATAPGVQGEIQLTDAIRQLALNDRSVFGYCFSGRRYDTGDKQGYLEAVVDFALKRSDLRDGFLEYLTKTVGRSAVTG